MPNIMQIQEILKGYTVDRSNIQHVGNMTVLPIVSDTEFTNVADVNEVTLEKDPTYNQLQFKNSGGQIGIALQGWTIIDDQPAQDRTIPYAHLIKAMNSKLVPANCIQSHQPGSFEVNKWNQENFMILPPSLRGIAIQKSTYRSGETGALWDSLTNWAPKINCREDGLRHFYSKFEDKLNQFVAQFEPVDKQLGAIVLINGELIAIDIMPKYNSWKHVWRAYIRDSYGAEALRIAETKGAKFDQPMIDSAKVNSLEDLEKQFSDVTNSFYDDVQGKVAQIIQLAIGYSKLEEINELTMLKLEEEHFTGQGVLHGDNHFIYLSLVSTKANPKVVKDKFKSLRNDPYKNDGFFFRN